MFIDKYITILVLMRTVKVIWSMYNHTNVIWNKNIIS